MLMMLKMPWLDVRLLKNIQKIGHYQIFLLLGYTRGTESLHVVVALDNEDNMIWIITLYRPEPGEWANGFTRG